MKQYFFQIFGYLRLCLIWTVRIVLIFAVFMLSWILLQNICNISDNIFANKFCHSFYIDNHLSKFDASDPQNQVFDGKTLNRSKQNLRITDDNTIIPIIITILTLLLTLTLFNISDDREKSLIRKSKEIIIEKIEHLWNSKENKVRERYETFISLSIILEKFYYLFIISRSRQISQVYIKQEIEEGKKLKELIKVYNEAIQLREILFSLFEFNNIENKTNDEEYKQLWNLLGTLESIAGFYSKDIHHELLNIIDFLEDIPNSQIKEIQKKDKEIKALMRRIKHRLSENTT